MGCKSSKSKKPKLFDTLREVMLREGCVPFYDSSNNLSWKIYLNKSGCIKLEDERKSVITDWKRPTKSTRCTLIWEGLSLNGMIFRIVMGAADDDKAGVISFATIYIHTGMILQGYQPYGDYYIGF